MYEETYNKTVRVKKWRQPKHPPTDITFHKLWSNHTMGYYATTKNMRSTCINTGSAII